jgi:hypothetical protein
MAESSAANPAIESRVAEEQLLEAIRRRLLAGVSPTGVELRAPLSPSP